MHDFTLGGDGANPVGNFVLDAAGNLYGATYSAGAYGYGTLFRLTPNANGHWTKATFSFNGHPAGYPDSGVIFDAQGNLYGSTAGDGQRTFGTIFEITP